MLGTKAATNLLRLPRVARLPIRSQPLQQCRHDVAVRAFAPSAFRLYAQTTTSRPGRPKKAVGEPSRPVKRAVKQAAKSPKEDAGAKQVKANKKTAAKKKAASKSAKKKKPALTDEQKTAQAERLARRKARKAKAVENANINELKQIALDPPPLSHFSAYQMLVKEKAAKTGAGGKGNLADVRRAFAETQHICKEEYRNLSPAQLEHYNHLRQTANEQQQAVYKRWVESHTADEIEAANKARLRLRRKLSDKPGMVRKYKAIKDERAVKKPVTPYALFTRSRWASGDFTSIKVPEAAKLMGQEWKALSEGEKKKYYDQYSRDGQRYTEEYSSVFGHAPLGIVAGQQPAQSAAAAA